MPLAHSRARSCHSFSSCSKRRHLARRPWAIAMKMLVVMAAQRGRSTRCRRHCHEITCQARNGGPVAGVQCVRGSPKFASLVVFARVRLRLDYSISCIASTAVAIHPIAHPVSPLFREAAAVLSGTVTFLASPVRGRSRRVSFASASAAFRSGQTIG